MKNPWVKKVYLGGTIDEAIEALEELKLLYPGPEYVLETFQDNELWLVNQKLKDELDKERAEARRKEEKEEEKALYDKLNKVYGKAKK